MTAIIGNDGDVTLPSGHNAILNRWRADLQFPVSNVTGFSDSNNQRNRVGIPNLTGSASGVPEHSAANTALAADAVAAGGASMTLTFATATTWTFTAAISGLTADAFKMGDTTITFNFTFGDADDFAETWDESS